MDRYEKKNNVHHKATWNGQYANFHGFVPFRCKRNLICCLLHSKIPQTLSHIREILLSNGYPDKSIERNCTERAQPVMLSRVGKELLFIKPFFKGNITVESQQSLQCHSENNLQGRKNQARVRYVSRDSVKKQRKASVLTSTMITYPFNCMYSVNYVG